MPTIQNHFAGRLASNQTDLFHKKAEKKHIAFATLRPYRALFLNAFFTADSVGSSYMFSTAYMCTFESTCHFEHLFNHKRLQMLLTRLRYAREVTLALIKPTVASSPNLTRDIISRINDQDFNIINAKKVQFTDSMAEAFYGDHKGKFFYPRLYNYVRPGSV